MTGLEEIFNELGISHYLHDFLEQGFDTWETILDITESDFDALGVKLGHRRKLQRKIANSRGLSSDRALQSPQPPSGDDPHVYEQKSGSGKTDGKDGGSGTHGAKRKYRRHPKPDENAPERPPSAYVIFSNKMRENLKGRNLSFTEIAKLVGENWQSLSSSEKESYEQQAFTAKDRYSNELAEYKATDQYREYSLYLADFKAKQANVRQTGEVEGSKKAKLETDLSTTSNGTGTSVASMQSSSTTGPWLPSDSQRSSEVNPKSTVAIASVPSKGQESPMATSPVVLPGYRDSLYAGGQHQNLAWKESERGDRNTLLQHLPRIASIDDRRPTTSTLLPADYKGFTGPVQNSRRVGDDHAPPLLMSELTNASSSTGSSAYFSPRTPIEPSLDRALPIPVSYNQKSLPGFENQLPPLRPLSPSFQTSSFAIQQSPTGNHTFAGFPSTIPPMRSFASWSSDIAQHDQRDHHMRDSTPTSLPEDNYLDPVSALLKAGEIVNRKSQDRSGIL